MFFSFVSALTLPVAPCASRLRMQCLNLKPFLWLYYLSLSRWPLFRKRHNILPRVRSVRSRLRRERSIFLVWATNVVRPALRVEAQVKFAVCREKTAHGVSFPLFLRGVVMNTGHDSSIIGVVSTDCSRKSDLRPRSAWKCTLYGNTRLGYLWRSSRQHLISRCLAFSRGHSRHGMGIGVFLLCGFIPWHMVSDIVPLHRRRASQSALLTFLG